MFTQKPRWRVVCMSGAAGAGWSTGTAQSLHLYLFWISFWIYPVQGRFVCKCYSWLHGAIDEYKITCNQIYSKVTITRPQDFCFLQSEKYQQSIMLLFGTISKSSSTNISALRLTTRSTDMSFWVSKSEADFSKAQHVRS